MIVAINNIVIRPQKVIKTLFLLFCKEAFFISRCKKMTIKTPAKRVISKESTIEEVTLILQYFFYFETTFPLISKLDENKVFSFVRIVIFF